MITVLVVDDQEAQRKIVAEVLAAEGHRVFTATAVDEALNMVKINQPEVVLTDLKMPGKGGLSLVEEIVRLTLPPEVIVVTAFGTVETAIKAIRLGAYDYLAKPLKPEELIFLVEKAQEKYILRLERQQLRKALVRETASNLVAKSLAMQKIVEMAEKAAASDATILIRGETGTGKECVARLIHLYSRRGTKPLQGINCAAFTETLLDSELFGYEKGAFTGAVSRKTGIIEAAANGTLFLDEIGDMSAGTQSKVLRVIQEKKIRRVGGTEDIPVDIRIITATNRNLEEAIAKGTFREDLYYRLNVVPIVIPPLRERKEDIPELVKHFFSKFSKPLKMDPAAMQLLLNYPWPGNVRELEALVERISVFSTGNVVTVDDLPPEISKKPPAAGGTFWDLPDSGISFDQWERSLLTQAMSKAGGNMIKAAKLLGLSYRAFRYRINAFGIKEDHSGP